MDKLIKIGTRNSKLALWQAEHVASRLRALGVQTELVSMETTGDKILNKSIAKIGSKGVFTEELEVLLHAGEIDIAVHSAKDMPSTLPDGLKLIAFSEREEPCDVVVSFNRFLNLEDSSQKLVMGTSSTRRIAFIKHFFPKIRLVEIRGNLQTRMDKMKEGLCDGLVLAFAGVHRMEYHKHIVTKLSVDKFTPAVGQGSLAIEASENLDSQLLQIVRTAINHDESEFRLLAERAYLKRLEGGCSIPSFALAHIDGEELHIQGGLISLNGKNIIRKEVSGHLNNAADLGKMLGDMVLEDGGEAILQEIREGNI